jgi:hypothetical protein
LFKKLVNSWAKEMDKQRFKEQEKRNKRIYYVDVCTNHSDLIQEIVGKCEEFVFGVDEELSEDISTIIKIEEYEKCIEMVKETTFAVKDNSKIYDLPLNAKQAYNDSMKHLLKGLEVLLVAYETNLHLVNTILLAETQELSTEDIELLQSKLSELTSPRELKEQYVHHRQLQINCIKTALDIINSH